MAWVAAHGEHVVAATFSGHLLGFDLRTGRLRWRALAAHRGMALCVALSPDGRDVASVGSDGEVAVWSPPVE